jgi:hypothetical protein
MLAPPSLKRPDSKQHAPCKPGKRKREALRPEQPHWTPQQRFSISETEPYRYDSSPPPPNALLRSPSSPAHNHEFGSESIRHCSHQPTRHMGHARKTRSLELPSPKRRRTFLTRTSPTKAPKSPNSHSPVNPLMLRPCEVCHRKPTTRAVLDGYVDCEDCGKRTCFICVRECGNQACRFAGQSEVAPVGIGMKYCQRPSSRRRMICRSCSDERVDFEGRDVVMCLDCHLCESELQFLPKPAVGRRPTSTLLFDGFSDRMG